MSDLDHLCPSVNLAWKIPEVSLAAGERGDRSNSRVECSGAGCSLRTYGGEGNARVYDFPVAVMNTMTKNHTGRKGFI